MTKDEALKLALEALEVATTPLAKDRQEVLRAQAAIREALAQPEQEPVACIGTNGELMWLNKPKVVYSKPIPLYTTPQPAQQQKPVVWMYVNRSTHETSFQKKMRSFVDHSQWKEIPLYSEPLANHELQCVCGAVWLGDEMVHLPDKRLPAQRKPLSDEQWQVMADTLHCCIARSQKDTIEAALGIKE